MFAVLLECAHEVFYFYNLGTTTDLQKSDSQSIASEHSSVDSDVTVAELKDFIFAKLLETNKINVHAKAPSMNDVRPLLHLVNHVTAGDEAFQKSAPRIISSRYYILFFKVTERLIN